MASPSQQGIPLGGYYPALSMYEYGLKHAYIELKDNYAKYFRPLGIRRYEMMKVMPFMMISDVLIGLEKPDYIDENTMSHYSTPPLTMKNKDITCKGKRIKKIEFSVVTPNLDGMSDKQKKRVDKEGLSRWYLRVYHNADTVTEDMIKDINDIITHKNKLKIRYLKCEPHLCSYISQKSRIQGEQEKKQDIRNASVIIEPLHNDMFNMVIPHIPINQSLPIGTNVIISVEIPFKGQDSERKFIWSSNLKTDSKIDDAIRKENPNSIYTKPWLECVHIGSVDIGSAIKGKFIVSEVDTSLQQSYQAYTFERDAEDKYFELGMYVCYNMMPKDLINKLIEILPDNKYLKEILAEL